MPGITYAQNSHMKISNPVTCEHYIRSKISFLKEELWCIALSDDCELLSHQLISEGDFSSVPIKQRTILEFALKSKANQIILVHSHTNQNSHPSSNDLFWTERIHRFLKIIDLKLCDHIILSRKSSTSLLQLEPHLFE